MKKLPLFIIVLLTIASCRKKTEEVPSTNCQIKQISETATESGVEQRKTIRSFTYNADGTLGKSSVVYMNKGFTQTQAIRFGRFNGFVIIEEAMNGADKFKVIDTMTLDAQGRIIKRHFPPNGAESEAWQFISYDNAGQVIRATTFSLDTSHFAPDTVDNRYSWANGNIERFNNTVYDYYDSPYNVGITTISFDDLMNYGQPVFKVSKLMKAVKDTTGRVLWNYTYELDKAQKIKKVVGVNPEGTSKSVTEVTYECQ